MADQQGNAFLTMNEADKVAYLSARSPAFTKLSPQEQGEYIRHMTSQMQPAAGQTSIERDAPHSFTDKLTAPGSSEGAQAFGAQHPILGKPIRALDAAGGAVLGLPGSIYHAFADPTNDSRSKWEAVPERLLGGEAIAGALKDYGSGKVSPGGAMSVLPEAIGTGAGVVAGTGLAGRGIGAITKPGVAKLARFGARAADFEFNKPLAFIKPTMERIANTLEDFAPAERDATLNAKNIPEFAGEEPPPPEPTPKYQPVRPKPGIARTLRSGGGLQEFGGRGKGGSVWNRPAPRNAAIESEAGLQDFGAESPRGRMGPPLRPVVGTPEDWQTYENRMNILTPEARSQGMYSAARGKVGRIPDYQERTGGAMSGFGETPPSRPTPVRPATMNPSADPRTMSPDFDLHQRATQQAVSEMKAGKLPEGMTTSGRAQQILDELKKAQ